MASRAINVAISPGHGGEVNFGNNTGIILFAISFILQTRLLSLMHVAGHGLHHHQACNRDDDSGSGNSTPSTTEDHEEQTGTRREGRYDRRIIKCTISTVNFLVQEGTAYTHNDGRNRNPRSTLTPFPPRESLGYSASTARLHIMHGWRAS